MIFLTLFFHMTCAWAQVGTPTDALGGASLGSSHPLDSAWTNPASLTDMEGAVIGGQYFTGKVAPGISLHQYGVTITDASSGGFPGSGGYQHRSYNVGGNTFSEYALRFSGAMPIYHNFSMGLAGYRVHTNALIGGDVNQDNGDLGVFWRAYKFLSFGAVTRALFGSKDHVFLPSKVRPSGGVGTEFDPVEYVRLRLDFNYAYEDNADRRVQTNFGVELKNMEYVSLRFGYNNDEFLHENRFTTGIAWDGPKLKLGYSYQKETRQKLGESHTIDIWLSF